jgi:hypothetical protein
MAAVSPAVAEVSPFLLIAGDPRPWPRPKDGTNVIDFSSFRTVDAVQLCNAVNTVSAVPLPNGFVGFYDRLRQSRNVIAHLNASAVIVEVKSLLVDILTAQRYLFLDIRWTTFRADYLHSTEQYVDEDPRWYEDDYTNDVITNEVNAALRVVDSHHLKEFLGFDGAKVARTASQTVANGRTMSVSSFNLRHLTNCNASFA